MDKYRKGNDAKFSDSAIADEDEPAVESENIEDQQSDSLSIIACVFPLNGRPFSAVNKQLLPKYFEQAEELFDEFGFRKKEENGESDPTVEPPLIETSQYRMKWLAHIQFTHEHVQEDLTWCKVSIGKIRHTPKFVEMLHEGDKDETCFKSYRLYVSRLGGMGVVAASLLLVCSEENSFWIMCSLIEDILPPNYYSHSLLGLRADERIIKHLLKIHMPELADLVQHCQTDMTLISVNWLITLLASIFPTRMLFSIWDHLFSDGSVVIFRVIISMLKMSEERLLEHARLMNGAMSSTDLFSLISQIPSTITDMDHLLEMVKSFEYSITNHLIQELRKKHQGILMADNNMTYTTNESGSNLPKQKINRRKVERKKSIIQQFFQQSADSEAFDDNDPKTKNIRQTELVIDLRNAIAQICKHFADCKEEKHEQLIATQSDYTPESHLHDREVFLKDRREGRRRGRALLDFERQEEDELGFQKNDLITIISEKDEHCWVGESVDGRHGWFPAKFVEVIDERGKNYCVKGDEAANSQVVGLARGLLSMAIRRILFHGIRSSTRMVPGFTSHPWPFIEALSSAIVDHNSNSTNSRLTLCDTFRLDQDGKILSPEELLFRAVKNINLSHNLVNAQLDVKLRSLVAFALNEQIKCELRLLSQFCFNLNVDSEVSGNEPKKSRQKPAVSTNKSGNTKKTGGEEKQPLKEGVRDMLIKHHLFSWDL